MKRIVAAFLLLGALAFGSGESYAQSTVNPTIPATNAPLNSAPVRSNFNATYNDINGILNMHATSTVGNCVSQPLVGTDCLVEGSPTLYSWYKYVGTNGYALVATVNPSVGSPAFTFTPSSGSIVGTSPITANYSGGVTTIGFNLSVANTFLAQQIDQGATTTQPGWYVQLAGDTTPRARFGLSNTDVPSIAFGSGSATRDTFLERAAAATWRLGSADSAAPVAQTLGVQNVVAGTSNTGGANLVISGSAGTGNGGGGSIIFTVAPIGTSGSTQNAQVSALTIYGPDGGISTGSSPTDPGAGNLNLGGGAIWNNGVGPTGTGGYVRATSPSIVSPSLITPSLGVASATSLAFGGCSPGTTAICITPTVNTDNQALSVTQSSSTSLSLSGPVFLNQYVATLQGASTTSGNDSYGNHNSNIVAQMFQTNVAAATSEAAVGLFTTMKVTTTAATNDVVAGVSSLYINVNATASTGVSEGFNAVALVDTAGSVNKLVGAEIDAGINTGGTATNRTGQLLGDVGNVHGGTIDAAMDFYSLNGTGWNKIFEFGWTNSTSPLISTTDIFFSHDTATINNIFNLPNVTVTTDIFNIGSNYVVTGAGLTTIGGTASSCTAGTTPLCIQGADGAAATVEIKSNTNTTTGFAGIEVQNSTKGADILFLANSAARTTTRWGVTLGNYAEFGDFGNSGTGLILGEFGAGPLILGTNNANRVQIGATGGICLGCTSDPGAGNLKLNGASTISTVTGSLTLAPASGLAFTLGSDATGDIFYRNSSGLVTRLPIGTNGQVLGITSLLPAWQAASSASSITANSTAIGGTCAASSLLYNNSSTIGCETLASTLTAGNGISITGTTNPTIALSLTNVSLQSGTLTYAGSTSIVMAGFGGTCKLTPTYSGRVRISFSGWVGGSGGANSNFYQFKYGTGAAPSAGAASIGTSVGPNIEVSTPLTSYTATSVDVVITGLTPGTAYWFDLAVQNSNSVNTWNESCSGLEY